MYTFVIAIPSTKQPFYYRHLDRNYCCFLSMRIANNAEKVTGAVNTSNEHAIVSKVVADLYISRMQ